MDVLPATIYQAPTKQRCQGCGDPLLSGAFVIEGDEEEFCSMRCLSSFIKRFTDRERG